MINGLEKINEKISEFEGQEIKLANYIVNNPKEAANLTITELATICEVSPSTVTRFCFHLGYNGYRELSKDLFASSLETSDKTLYDVTDHLDNTMSTREIIDAVSKFNIDTILRTQRLIDETQLEEAINLIDKANNVSIFSTSGSVAVAEDAAFKFNRLGIRCTIFSYSHDQILIATKSNSDDVGLFISYSGDNKDLINAIKIMSERNVPTIAITKYGSNTISKFAKVNIQHSNFGSNKKTYSTRSRIVQENIIDILFIALRQRREGQLQQYYKLFEK